MRGKKAKKRDIIPDPKFSSVTVAKLINHIMSRGKKSVAQKIIYQAFDIISQKTSKNPLDIFDLALKNVGPDVEVRTKRVGGANYQIPFPVRGDRKLTLSLRWIIGAAKTKKGQPMAEKLASELMAAANEEGAAIKKKEEVFKSAQANKAFAHFAR
ncbi:MAG: 30S ribosomal protein S7 [Patescibacteria group bacterium]|jgi:small subunit ribosomal protein S7|nr:30S ribosomal protein S7 [Patescibacteria group bacterium]